MNSEMKTEQPSMIEFCTLKRLLRATIKRQTLPNGTAHVCDPSSGKTEAWLRPATQRGKHQKMALYYRYTRTCQKLLKRIQHPEKHLFFIIVINSVNGIRLPASDNKMACLSLRQRQQS